MSKVLLLLLIFFLLIPCVAFDWGGWYNGKPWSMNIWQDLTKEEASS